MKNKFFSKFLSEKKVENILYPSKTKLKEKLIKGGIIYEKD